MSKIGISRRYLWKTRFLLMFLFLVIGGFHTAATQAADAQWQAKYWNNRTLSGDPV
jgi:hypothetical protein